MPVPDLLKNRLSLPVVGSPLFIVSGPELVIAQCKAGVIGSFPALNARPAPVLGEWLKRIKGELADWEAKTGRKAAPFALVPEVRAWFKGTILLSGSIADGRSIFAAEALGADLAYIGTRFIATEEANAVDGYKQAIIDSAADDIVYSNLFTGVHGNYLAPSISAAGLDPANLPQSDKSKMNFGSGGNMDKKAWKDIWGAGQGVGQVKTSPSVAELVGELKAQYDAARTAVFGANPALAAAE